MKRSCALATAGIGAWVALAPVLLSWQLSPTVMASSVLPGAIVAMAGGYCGVALLPDGYDVARQRLAVSLTSSMLLLGVWLLLNPFLLGIPLLPSVYAGLLLPGAGVVCLSLANGYFGWRAGE